MNQDNETGINQAYLSGVLIQKSVLRYTPAGVAVVTLDLNHQSQVQQAGSHRTLAFTVQATALADAALAVDDLALDGYYCFEGFWAPVHYRSQRLGFQVLKWLW